MDNPTAQQAQPADLESHPVPAWLKWFETLAVTALFVGFGVWNRPEDPLYLSGSFPWPVLAPLLAGLRYGFFNALVSALLLLGALGLLYRQGLTPSSDFPYVWCIGVLAFSLIAGEFRDYWGRRIEKLEASNRYREVRLEEFTRNFYLLKVSHDRLEQQLAGSSGSLREALRRLYQEIAHVRGSGLNQETGELLLHLLIRYGQLQIAAVYPVTKRGISDSPVAQIGAFEDVRSDDPLLLHALREKKLVSVQSEYRKKLADLDTDLLLALPLIDSTQSLIGLVAVKAMPFFNFEPKTLRLLAILTGHLADIVQTHVQVPESDTAEWQQFLFQLMRASQDARHHALPASLIRLTLTRTENLKPVLERMRQLRRGLDVIAERPDGQGLEILLPLTDELGQAAYLQRLEQDLREQTGRNLSQLATISARMLTGDRDRDVRLAESAEGISSS